MKKLPDYFEFKNHNGTYTMTLDKRNGLWCCEEKEREQINNGVGFWSAREILDQLEDANSPWEFTNGYNYLPQKAKEPPSDEFSVTIQYQGATYTVKNESEAFQVVKALHETYGRAALLGKYQT